MRKGQFILHLQNHGKLLVNKTTYITDLLMDTSQSPNYLLKVHKLTIITCYTLEH